MAEVSTTEKMQYERKGICRYDAMPLPTKILYLVMITASIGLFIFYTFGFNVRGFVFASTAYYFLLYVFLVVCIFITIPARKKDRDRVPWYDYVLGVIGSGIAIYWYLNALPIDAGIWRSNPSTINLVTAGIFGLLCLESGRRIGHAPFFILCIVLGLYPLFAGYMPGLFYGYSMPFSETIANFAYGHNGVLGLPGRVLGEILVGYLLFGGLVLASGAGDFFTKFALALLGTTRGGPAKVAVVSSGFFGSLSGAPAANIVATGSFTIPAMKKLGYEPHYAAAIEAVASSGGGVMPPVMASVAFIMAELAGVAYADIVVAAIIPAALFYFGLFVGVDPYAGRKGLVGVPKKDVPSMKQTLKEGWPFIVVLIFLIWGLMYMRWSIKAPVYASALMFVLSFTNKETRLTWNRLGWVISRVGDMVIMVIGILIPVGLMLSGITITGTVARLTTGILAFAGGNLVPVLLIGVLTCYIMGMGGMGGLAYIFLAVTMAPALVKLGGLNLIAVHFFIVYYALTSGITPPIAVNSWIAAAMADSPPMKTAVTSMRLAVVIYFVPFFFLFNPALILQGPSLWESLYLFVLALIGVMLVASGLEGYIVRIGKLALWSRPLLVITGLLTGFPEWISTFAGLGLAVVVLIFCWRTRKPGQITAPGY